MKNYVVITGASSGIRQALTLCFANAGHHVIAIGRNEIALQRTKALTKNENITTVAVDLSQDAELDKIPQLLTAEDKISHVIHCAAL